MGARFPCATRHILTDTIGLPVAMIVHPANVQDRDGARPLCWKAHAVWCRGCATCSPMAATRAIS